MDVLTRYDIKDVEMDKKSMKNGRRGNHYKKIGIMGDTLVGKSSLIKRFIIDEYKEKSLPNRSYRISKKRVEFHNKGQYYDMMIWDAYPKPGYEEKTYSFLKDADGIFVVCDISQPESEESLDKWISDMQKYLRPDIPVIILVNKYDLFEKNPVIGSGIVKKLKRYGYPVFITSAKTGFNVEKVFKAMAEMLQKRKPMIGAAS